MYNYTTFSIISSFLVLLLKIMFPIKIAIKVGISHANPLELRGIKLKLIAGITLSIPKTKEV